MGKEETNIPVNGMVDSHPMNIKDNQYPFMLNGNIQTDISSGVTLTNEHSNLLCNKLPAGYVVIGSVYDPEDSTTYVWLVNPTTNKSQIGYLTEYTLVDANDLPIPNDCLECASKKQEATPLEATVQSELCNYGCITASDCLNFNIDFPIRKAVIKKDNCGDTIYFTDFRNPVRALKVTPGTRQIDPTQRGIQVSGTCDTSPIYYPFCSENDLNCLSIQLFPTVAQPNVTAKSIGLGGALKAGTYQLGVCYADQNGQRATRTFAMSNPVAVFDPNQTITDQVSYPTNMSIQFLIENLDNSQYKYIDIFVIGTISGVSTVKQYNTVNISSLIDGTLQYTLSDFEKGKESSIDNVLQVFPVYELAQEITTANNILLLGNLTGPRDLNLQQAVVKLSPLVKWATSEVSETFYKDGVNAANYRGYLRDEVYPLGIVFERNNTLDTCAYPFIGRASTPDDLVPVNNSDAWQYPGCDTDPNYNLRWKVYNTANNQGGIPDCDYNSPTGTCATIIDHVGCSSFEFRSSTIVIGSIVGGTGNFAIGDTVTGPHGTATVLSVTQQHATLAYITVLTTSSLASSSFQAGDTITNGSGVSTTVSTFNLGDIPPNDCYISNSPSVSGICTTNYPVLYSDPSINCNVSDCTENVNPSGSTDPGITCLGYVRPQTAANGNLCIDSQLLQYPSGICTPYAYRIGFKQEEVEPLQTNAYFVYNLSGITNAVPVPPNPTPALSSQYAGAVPATPQDNGTWIWPGIFSPSPINNLETQALTVPSITQDQGCIEYQSTILATINTIGDSVRYFLGDNPDAPTLPCASGCTFPANYWGTGPAQYIGGVGASQRNTTSYQSRWYKIQATTPTLIVKMKLGFPDTTTFQQGDLRIDVYDHLPTGLPGDPVAYSTGLDTTDGSANQYYYTGADADQGVLIIGDVASSVAYSANGVPAVQEPLVQGKTYWIHCFLLPQGQQKLNSNTAYPGASICNPNYDPTSAPADTYPCYLVRYAWSNFCIEYPSTPTTKSVTTPALSQMNCEYAIVYRQKQIPNASCELQPYQYGDFAYWESNTKTYPTTTFIDASGNTQPLWGDVCGQPIRHFKFPDCLVSPVQDEDSINLGVNGAAGNYVPNNSRQARVYPMGIRVEPEDVKQWLIWAESQGLITDQERLSITGYKIVRGNRATNKSIIAKGLLFDMFQYKQRDWVSGAFDPTPYFYPNYPFNDLRPDPYVYQAGSGAIKAPLNGAGNSKYTFLSADTTFNAPALGQELKVEAVNFGDSLGKFYEVKNHPKYVLLGEGGVVLVGALAGIELSADLLVLLGQLYGSQEVGFTDTIPVGFYIGLVGGILNLVPRLFQYMAQWNQLITNFGVPFNFAQYYAAVGNYHSSGDTGELPNDVGNKRRIINTSSYLLGGNLSLPSSGALVRINNYEREDSVYLDLGTTPSAGFTYSGTAIDGNVKGDFSKFTLSGNSANNGPSCSFTERGGSISSMYASIKTAMLDQYGSVQDIEWVYTGNYQKLDWATTQPTDCIPIYGGDTFVSRMTQKRKIPFFLDNTVGARTGVDSQYQRISNITDSTYFFNSIGESTLNSSAIQFSPVEQNLDCYVSGHKNANIYVEGYMYLFSYGIVSFIGESDFNLNYRYAKGTNVLDFYPHMSDIETWTQEAIVPIYNPNSYFYNRDYSKQNKENFFCTQPVVYHNDTCVTTYRNRVITSIPDNDSDFYNDNWRIFLGNDYHDFSLTDGNLMGLDGIERDRVMVRLSNTTMVFNAFYTLDTNAGTVQVGTGAMFDQKPEEYVKSDLGYSGTDNHAFVSTPEGHFWVDAAKHNIFMMPPHLSARQPAGEGLKEIGEPYATFFRNNLPFFLLRDFPDFNTDNNYKGVGITIGWDNKFNRVFVTKMDYQLLSKYKGKVVYSNNQFTLDGTVIELNNTNYFCNKSWTASYSPSLKTWLSFHSFIPNYYIGHENYFQTGVNFTNPGATATGLWNHLVSNKSYQVYYGKLYPFITDVVVKEQLFNKQLLSLEYQSDYLRFQNDYDYYYNPDVTFNKMAIWTENQNSGNLVLVPQKPNDLSQALRYPITNPDSTTIMVTRKTNSWRLNQFADLVANKHNNVPPMIYNCSPYLKEVNPMAMRYNKPTFQRQHLTSDYFTTRFINDEHSNYKIINKWFLNNTLKYKT